MGQFSQLSILFASTLFMALGGIPSFLFVRLLNGQTQPLLRDKQIHFFLTFLVLISSVIALYRIIQDDTSVLDALVHALFNVTSVVTTSGGMKIFRFQLSSWPRAGRYHWTCRKLSTATRCCEMGFDDRDAAGTAGIVECLRDVLARLRGQGCASDLLFSSEQMIITGKHIHDV